jgi:hypothetical protein
VRAINLRQLGNSSIGGLRLARVGFDPEQLLYNAVLETGRHAFNPKALKALGVDPAVAREQLGYPLKDSEDPESNLAA